MSKRGRAFFQFRGGGWLLLFMGLFLAACQLGGCVDSQPDVVPTWTNIPTEVPVEAPPSTLEGQVWCLLSYVARKGNPVDVLPGSEINIEFRQGRLSGFAGCNSYHASYKVKGKRLSFTNAGLTEMFCMSPVGVMEQEHNYLAALQEVVKFQLADERLQLLDAQGRTLLIYRR